MVTVRRRIAVAVVFAGAAFVFAAATAAPSSGDVFRYWQRTFQVLDAFRPSFVATLDGTRMWQSGWEGRTLTVRSWPGDGSPVMVVAAGFPPGVPPPDDGLTWAVLPPQPWTPAGLPDPDAYCIRRRAMWLAQTVRAAEAAARQRLRIVLLAEGLDAPAALAVAAGSSVRVVEVVLVNPRPWRHFEAGRVAIGGREGRALAAVVQRHRQWKKTLAQRLRPFDIAELAPLVKCPVVVMTGLRRPPEWVMATAEEYGWTLVHTARRSPPLKWLVGAGVFDALWAEALGYVDLPWPVEQLARAAP